MTRWPCAAEDGLRWRIPLQRAGAGTLEALARKNAQHALVAAWLLVAESWVCVCMDSGKHRCARGKC